MLWTSEADVQRHVTNVLEDVIAALGLQQDLSTRLEVGIDGHIPDVVVITSNGVPKGVVEVKTPLSPDIMTDGLLHGQVYSYLMWLKSFYNISEVIGIATTYEEWRICWLSVSDTGEVDEALHGSEVKKYNDPDIIKFIASALQKMNSATWIKPTILKGRPLLTFNPKGWSWEKCQVDSVDHEKLPAHNCQNFMLVEDLGCGLDGHVWRACSKAGRGCVIKFPRLQKEEKQLPKKERISILDNRVLEEYQNWGLAQTAVPVRVVTLNEINALLMPSIETFTEKPANENILKQVIKLIGLWASKGLLHDDLEWRHVGKWNNTIVFIDLASVLKKIDPKKAQETMLRNLGLDMMQK